jgi:acyl transferase domain-containing protein
VVTEKVPWTGNLAGIRCLGIRGTNACIILQRNQKNKVNGGSPTDSVSCLVSSGHAEEAVDVSLKDVSMLTVTASCYT